MRACILRYRLRQSWHRGQAGTSAWVLPGHEIKSPRADRGRSRPRKPGQPRGHQPELRRVDPAAACPVPRNTTAWRSQLPLPKPESPSRPATPRNPTLSPASALTVPTPAPPGLPELAWRYSKDEATTTPLLDYSRCHALDDDPADCRLHRALTACPTGSDLRRREYRTGISGTTSKRLGPPRQSQIIGIDLISYQNDRKSCTATVGNVERA